MFWWQRTGPLGSASKRWIGIAACVPFSRGKLVRLDLHFRLELGDALRAAVLWPCDPVALFTY
jgi:hypothetical protein